MRSESTFQSLDWVDVDFDSKNAYDKLKEEQSFNPSTGLMLISTSVMLLLMTDDASFNPSTGLMLISTF